MDMPLIASMDPQTPILRQLAKNILMLPAASTKTVSSTSTAM